MRHEQDTPEGETDPKQLIICDLSPELEQVSDLLGEEATGHFSELHHEKEIEVSRHNIVKARYTDIGGRTRTSSHRISIPKTQERKAEELVLGAVSLILNSGTSDIASQEAQVESILIPFKKANNPIGEYVKLDVLSRVEILGPLIELANSVNRKLNTIARNNPSMRYELLKLLNVNQAVLQQSTDSSDKQLFALQYVCALDYALNESDSLVSSMHNGLKDGEFDSCIAQDALMSAYHKPEGKPGDKRTNDLGGLVQLMMAGLDLRKPEAAIDILSKPDNLPLWPPTQRKMLKEKVEVLTRALTSNSSTLSNALKEHGLMPTPSIPRERVEELAVYAAHILRAASPRYGMAGVHALRSKIEAGDPSLDKELSGRGKGSKKHEVKASHRKLVIVTEEGQELPEGTEEFKKFIHDYQQQNEREYGLKSWRKAGRIPAMLETLQQADLTVQVKGMWLLDSEQALYAAEPYELIGQTTRIPKERRKCIVLKLSADKSTLSLLNIVDRDKLDKRYPHHGMH